MKSKKMLAAHLSALLYVTGCEYVPREVYEIETVDGKVIKLACQAVDSGRGRVTYIVDGECVIYKSDK